MPLKSIAEAAMHLGYSVELLEACASKCPKPGQTRTLPFAEVGGTKHFAEDELESFRRYLREPWPTPKRGGRPSIPKCIQDDVRAECHYQCAICGSMDNGELAHIDAVSSSFDNSPDNLLLLCPNHHSKYDYGYRASSNIDRDVVLAAKRMKRAARVRVLRFEANAVAALRALLKQIETIEAKAKATDDGQLRMVLAAETKSLLADVPGTLDRAEKAAQQDHDLSNTLAALTSSIAMLALVGTQPKADERAIRQAATSVVQKAAEAFDDFDLDEVECPHCSGHGTTGLVGDYCKYCRGSCVVTEQEAKDYDADDIDEVSCPHCHGRGTTGLVGDICKFCRGSCVVSQADADSYVRDDMDEVECPHCHGRGTTGLVGDICKYCRGSCVVSAEHTARYTPDDMDEVECPHCHGRGTTGLIGDICKFCVGAGVVSTAGAEAYDPEEIDEVECPHCCGNGTIGVSGDYCTYCGGSCVVSSTQASAYDPTDIDEVGCPHCGGHGTTGLRGDICKLCGGKCVVSQARHDSYRRKYPEA